MAKRNCARPGCGEPLTKASQVQYCSTACANMDKPRMRQEQMDAVRLASNGGNTVATASFQGDIKSIRSGVIPSSVEEALVTGIGHHRANVVLSEIEEQIKRGSVQLGVFPDYLRRNWPIYPSAPSLAMSVPRPSLTPPTSHNIEPDTTLLTRNFGDGGYVSDIRRSSDITYNDIDRLMKLGPYVLASRIKKGGVMDALTTGRKWDVQCSDAKLRAVVKADLERVLMRYAHDMLLAWDYGVAFGSTIWTQRTAERIGVEKGVGKQTKWYVIDQIEWAHPSTVTEILRDDKTNSFRGYFHRRAHMDPMYKAVTPPQALVLTHDGRFGNLWGQSMAEPVYDFAFWYEVVMRGFLNYLQRMGIPVAVCYGPSRGRTRRPDGTVVDNPTYGLLMAGYAAHHSAIYLPSDVDIQTNQPLWRLEYLPTDQKGEHFIAALRYLGTQITRGVIVGDRAATQDSETGSYNAASIHNQLTQIDNNFLFMRLLGQLNDYLVIRYAEFNVDANNPPLARLIAQVIGPEEQAVMMKLFATAGNVKIGDGTPLEQVNWEEAFRSIQVPILTEEEREEQRKKRLEEKKEAQEMFQQTQAKFAGPPQPGKNGGDKPVPGQSAQPKPSTKNDKDARLAVLEHLADGGSVPLMLTAEQVQALAHPEQELIVLREPDKPSDPEFEKVHPRDEHGRFSKKRKEGEGEDEKEDGEKKVEGEDQLNQEPWPGADPEKGIKGVVTLDGVEYTVIGNTSREELLAMHRTNIQMYQRADEFGVGSEVALREIEPENYRKSTPADPEFEKQHPRDAFGRFSKKSEEGKKDEDEDDEDGQQESEQVVDQRDDLLNEPWPGADLENGIKGSFVLDNVQYTVVGDWSREEILAAHETTMRTLDRANEMGVSNVYPAIELVDTGNTVAMHSYLNYQARETAKLTGSTGLEVSLSDVESMTKIMDGYYTSPTVTGLCVDRKMAQNPEMLEPMVFRSILHMRERLLDNQYLKEGMSPQYGRSRDYQAMEGAYTDIIVDEYCERYGLPRNVAQPSGTSSILEAANRLGWDQQRLRDFAKRIHEINGDQYPVATAALFAEAEMTWGQYKARLQSTIPAWAEYQARLEEMYDFRAFYRQFHGGGSWIDVIWDFDDPERYGMSNIDFSDIEVTTSTDWDYPDLPSGSTNEDVTIEVGDVVIYSGDE